MRKQLLYWLAALAPAMPIPAAASCGSAFCSINTNWDVQGATAEPGLRADLRYEYIRQDQPMSGSRKVAVGEIPRHHDEVGTTNRNWLPSIDYGGPGRGGNPPFSLSSPAHQHNPNHMGAKTEEN